VHLALFASLLILLSITGTSGGKGDKIEWHWGDGSGCSPLRVI
jgi:hypothetical protein